MAVTNESYPEEHTPQFHYKDAGKRTQPIRKVCGCNSQLFNIKARYTQSDHCCIQSSHLTKMAKVRKVQIMSTTFNVVVGA